jgi:DNA (cytosine-5)-methyltransferase 1
MLTFGSLFSGIGGFDLGFERAGFRCVWQVEKDEFCRKVLRKHWPYVSQWDDVTTFNGEGFERPDVIIGGFPCQDLSMAGARAGLEGDRSGLYSAICNTLQRRLARTSHDNN